MNNSDRDLLGTIELVIEAIEEKEFIDYSKNYISILKNSEMFFNDEIMYYTSYINSISHKEARLSLKLERLFMIISQNFNKEIFCIPDLDKDMLRKFRIIKEIREEEETKLLNLFN